jgi:hypothetical protein
VATGENGGCQILDDIDLADDSSRDLIHQSLTCLRQLLQELEVALVSAVLLA